MRDASIIRLLVILLLAGGMLGAPLLVAPASSAVAQEENKKDKEEKDDKKDKKDKEDKDKQKDDAEVSETEGYLVDVDCQVDEAANTTTCIFTGIAPEGASDVGHVQLPEEAVCTAVIGGEHEYVDPDPNTGITGYKSEGSEARFTLVLEGEVSSAGTTTYWFKTGAGVFPGLGPGLQCGAQSPETSSTPDADDVMTDGTPAATEPTGELAIMVYRCANVPADTASFDWFGECDPASDTHTFVLELLSDTAGAPTTTESDQSGSASFDTLEPGLYSLEMTDVAWCHATSDNVNTNGKLIVEEGGRTTVWLFTCESTG